jgi:predicted transcriptional regulator
MNYKKVRDVIFERGLKKSFIAKQIGVTNVWFSYYLNGKKDLGDETLDKLKKTLEL